jgi:LPXTG-motif cell wall-anchored protein
MNKVAKKWANGVMLSITLLLVLSFAIFIFAKQPILSALRIVFGSVYVLFIPGFLISYIFFPKTKEFEGKGEKDSIDWIERIALSFALSIAIVPLAVFYLNLVGVRINFLNSFLTVLGVLIISSGILYYKRKK